MKSLTIHKVNTKNVKLPTSKSISNRLLVLNALLKGELVLQNLSRADDTVIMEKMVGKGFHCTIMDVKNAGTCYRFLTAYNALHADEVILKGSDEMNKRPIKILVDALQTLGAEINYLGENGYPPLRIVGKKLKGDKVLLPGSVSSQYISALCMIGPFLENGLTISIQEELKSASYLDMTIKLMQQIGFSIVREGQTITIGTGIILQQKVFEIEADWSSASYWYSYLSFCAVGEELFLNGLMHDSVQGDAVIAKLFEEFGVFTYYETNGVRLVKEKPISIKTFTYNFSSIPDMVQTFVVTCIGNGVEGVFNGVAHLKYKETNRLEALRNEVIKIGGELVFVDEDCVKVKLSKKQSNRLSLRTYEDHRMAMAFAPLVKKGFTIEVENPAVVVKSYPNFWDHFE